ncbi:Cof-type HAD-IIB family hydrolase [Paenibacillus rigui]|uniref:Cof-type HAD-IIB family hydrolase n=1 Tax=Paenibacillus rigui TaxID=554312 RepID=UPI002481B256|nr:Cof-type HAD-IIB family hydrolase [Paenibacillus rigui]
MQKTDYKAVFCDIDGTLLNSEHQITPGTRSAVHKLKPLGVPFILVSARMPEAIVPLQQELGITDPLIAFSGGLVLSGATEEELRKPLASIRLGASLVSELFTLTAQAFPEVSCSAYTPSRWLVPEADAQCRWIAQEQAITGTVPMLFDPQELSRAGSANQTVHKIMCMGEPDQIDGVLAVLREQFPRLAVYKSKPTYVEIMAPLVSKSAAIRVLESFLGISRSEVIAIGDNYNDADMLQYAGLGVAMGNAPDEVKAQADEVTGSNDEDGLRQMLEKYFGV